MSVALAVVWYGIGVLIIVLLCIAADKQRRVPWLANGVIERERNKVEYVSLAVAWMLLITLVLAGLVDIVIWASKSDAPSVSDWVHITLIRYPWIAWVAAGLTYHLLVDHPVFP